MHDGELFHPVTLRNSTIPGNLFLAPLAGFTDKAFRQICIEHGASFTYTEMVSCEGVLRKNKKTVALMEPADNEKQYGIQFFSSVPDSAARAVELASITLKPTLFDLNCGCPVPKIVRSGAGAALLKEPEKIARIVRSMCNAADVPVTVKIRSGWDASSINYLETADAAVSSGALMVTLHARTRTQGYSGNAERNHISNLKKHCSVPVFASGDIFTPEGAVSTIKETACDGVIFARGAIGNPTIFLQTSELMKKGYYQDLPPQKKLTTATTHLNLAIQYLGESRACREMKKHLCAYTKGIPGGAALRNKIVHVQNCDEYRELIAEFLQNTHHFSMGTEEKKSNN